MVLFSAHIAPVLTLPARHLCIAGASWRRLQGAARPFKVFYMPFVLQFRADRPLLTLDRNRVIKKTVMENLPSTSGDQLEQSTANAPSEN